MPGWGNCTGHRSVQTGLCLGPLPGLVTGQVFADLGVDWMLRGQGTDITHPPYLLSGKGFPRNAEPHSFPLVSPLSGHQNSSCPGCDSANQYHTLRVPCALGAMLGTTWGIWLGPHVNPLG